MSDYIKEAKRAKREGDLSKAGDLFYLGGDVKNALDCYVKGNHFALAARLMEKEEDWRGAAKYHIQAGKYSDAAEIYVRLKDYRTASLMFEKQGNLTRAVDMAHRGGDISRAALLADQAELWDKAASLWLQINKYDRAADIYYRLMKQLAAEKEDKGFLETQRERLRKCANAAGTLYLRQKKYDRAAECFVEAENQEKAAESYLNAQHPEKAIEMYCQMQDYERAYELLLKLPENMQDKKLRADICLSLRRYEEAGDLFLQAGQPTRAAEAYEEADLKFKAAVLYEGEEEYSHAAELFLALKEPGKAAELYEKAKNYEYAARLYEQAGRMDRAINALLLCGKRIEAARLLIQKNEHQKAIPILQDINQDQDEYHEACLLLGELFTTLEMYPVALQKLIEATKNNPISRDNIDLYYALALAHERSHQYSKAREVFEKILSVQMGYRDVFGRLQNIKQSNLMDGGSAEATPTSMRKLLMQRYELEDKIGRDAWGTLYKARDISLDRPVMIRRFPEQDTNLTRNLVEYTKAVSSLTHSNIQAVYDSGKDEDHYFLCLEFLEGQTLRQSLTRGPIDISDICEVASQICIGLAYAHKKGVFHKNLSPENIYLCPGNVVKIANFALEAKVEKGSTIVPKQYMSPEQLLGQKVDSRSDFYSLGIVLYEMVYGVPPFSGADVELQQLKKPPSFPEGANRLVPAFLLKIIQRCLSKDRMRRYAAGEEILEELEVADIVPGLVVNQRYEILKELGSGGMGRVYKAKDRDLDEIVVLKVLRAEVSADPIIQKRFMRELKVTRMITHPNVVKVFDTGKYKGNRYISMEFIEGTPLDEWAKANPKSDLKTLMPIVGRIIQGVMAAHLQGVVHRDLKPQNVLLDKSLNPKVLDFGIARSKDLVDATSTGQILGSPKYMSPEQIQGKDLDARSDIYAIGCLLFYLVAGREPFVGDDPRTIIMKHLTDPAPSLRSVNPEAPAWLEKVLKKALEKDRNQRYASLKELLDDLKKGYEAQK